MHKKIRREAEGACQFHVTEIILSLNENVEIAIEVSTICVMVYYMI